MKAIPLHTGHGWLAGVLPEGATRFRVVDRALATTIAHAGGLIVDAAADVDVGPADWVGEADVCIVPLGASTWDVDSRVRRAATRLAVSVGVRAAASSARRALASRGYAETTVVYWDVGQRLRSSGTRLDGNSIAGRLPQRAAVIASRSAHTPTVYEAVVRDAIREAGLSSRVGPPVVREGLLVVPSAEGILRFGIGPATLHLDRQFDFLTRLSETSLPASVRARIPWPLARGRRGLVNWSVEQRLPGRMPEPKLSAAVAAACLDFLVDLHRSTSVPGAPDSTGVIQDAAVVASACAPEDGEAITRLAARVGQRLANFPRGYGHGDFYRGNLLTDDRGLVGVVDWDTGVPAALPFLDLFHLKVFSDHRPADHRWGAVVTEHLLPLAGRGGDADIREYGRRIGVDPSPAELEAFVVAYWLSRLAVQLTNVADRTSRRRWLDENVHRAARVLVGAVG